MPTLYVDAREEARHHWSDKLRHLNLDAKVGSNLPADFLWQCPSGLVLVERKTWADFVSSLTTSGGADAANRFVGQLIDGPKGVAVRILFIEGPMPPYIQEAGRTIPAEDFDNASVSLQWQFGCIVVHSLNNDHTPIRLAKLFTYTQKQSHESLLRPMPPVPEGDVYMNAAFRRKIAALMTVPLVGEKGALIIAEHTQTLKEAVNMEQDELIKMPGIGKTRASNFYEFWNAPW